MGSINCSDSVKAQFDEQNRDEFDTQGDFLEYLLEVERAYEGQLIDHSALADEMSKRLIPHVENAAYRGVSDFSEWNGVVLVPRDAVDTDALE